MVLLDFGCRGRYAVATYATLNVHASDERLWSTYSTSQEMTVSLNDVRKCDVRYRKA